MGAGTGAFPIPSSNTAPVAGTARALTESLVKSAMQTAYTAGGSPGVLLVRPSDKVIVSTFSGNATRFEQSDSNELNAAFDFYVTDFGRLKVVPDRFFGSENSAYLLDLDHVTFKTLRNVEAKPLAKTGDAEKMLLTWEYGLQMDNKDAHAVIRDLT